MERRLSGRGPVSCRVLDRVSCLTLVGGWLSTLLGPEGSAVWLVSSGPPSTCVPACVGVWGLVGLLFEICIVDASISRLVWFHGSCCGAGVGCGCVVLAGPFLVLRGVGRLCDAGAPLIGVCWCVLFMCVVLTVCCCDVVETSYEGHMVDALASRADEGRWSLR